MKKLFYLLVLLPVCAFAQNPKTVGDVANTPHLAMGRPGTDLAGVTLIARRGYACLHSAGYKEPLWVAYLLTSKDLEISVPRVDSFKPDPNLKKGFRAEKADYRKPVSKTFDRGHMAPCEDMTRDVDTMKESFYLSNIIPQEKDNNEHFWNELEARLRDYTKTYGSLYILTGPVFGKPLPAGSTALPASVGPGKVKVPTWIFKIAVRELSNGGHKVIALEVPNIPISRKPNLDAAITKYLTSVDKIEKDTGLNFLNALSVKEQKKIEAKKAALWVVSN